MIELLFLLLPVAAGYGWIMGKNSAKNQAYHLNREVTSQYSKGLKFLLDREEDQGLEYLINLLEVLLFSLEFIIKLSTIVIQPYYSSNHSNRNFLFFNT